MKIDLTEARVQVSPNHLVRCVFAESIACEYLSVPSRIPESQAQNTTNALQRFYSGFQQFSIACSKA